ncbi:MAG: hypothetical protein Ta2B_01970 [Termitinemataceae bacterium]|nr:MAG: hypothetical protein Ta2B_01970 [Termitinemataceae bacterium]
MRQESTLVNYFVSSVQRSDVPQIVRARDFYLYTKGGKRLVDLWQYGGRTILGHKSSSIVKEIKNSIERGLFLPLPSIYEQRFLKALKLLFGENFFCTASDTVCRNCSGESERLPVWRAFFKFDGGTTKTFRAILPCPICPDIIVTSEVNQSAQGNLQLAPYILSAAARSIYDLLSSKERGNVNYKKINAAIGNNNNFTQSGIYITHNSIEAEYKTMFLKFLEAGFFLPPNLYDPIILPPTLSTGEQTKLLGLFES